MSKKSFISSKYLNFSSSGLAPAETLRETITKVSHSISFSRLDPILLFNGFVEKFSPGVVVLSCLCVISVSVVGGQGLEKVRPGQPRAPRDSCLLASGSPGWRLVLAGLSGG